MIVTRIASAAFDVAFESEQELRDEHRANLAFNALRLVTTEAIPLHSTLLLTLRGPGGGEAFVRATVVALLPDGIALAIAGTVDDLLERLLAGKQPPQPVAPAPAEHGETAWDRIRGLSQMEKILLAVKADRSERALLSQDNDPRVLLSLLRNPRLTVDEVVRVAKSPFLNYQIADVIGKTTHWMASLDVRLALIHNAKTPPAMALRILPTLPVTEVRSIARSGTSMALKQAAIRQLQGKA